MNTFKTTFLMVALTLLLLGVGQLIGGRTGLIFAFVLAAAMNMGSYWFSDKIVLAMYRARGVTPAEAPGLYKAVSNLTQKAGLPMPKLYIIPNSTPNAFATGRSPEHAAVAVTEGILKILDLNELEGVLAHELAHVGNRDILISSIVATMAGAIMMLSSMTKWAMMFGGFGGRDNERGGNPLVLLIVAILAPIAATIIQLAISRSREYQADETGARLSHNPLGLANALRKLEKGASYLPMEANPSTAHLFIVNPLRGRGLMSLFSTHPPVDERVRRLEELAKKGM